MRDSGDKHLPAKSGNEARSWQELLSRGPGVIAQLTYSLVTHPLAGPTFYTVSTFSTSTAVSGP